MSLLTPADLAGLRGVFADMAWGDPANAATIYDADAVSNPRSAPVITDNTTALKSRREASLFVSLIVQVETVIGPSCIVCVTARDRWYIVAQVSDIAADVQATLIAQSVRLPLLLTVERAAAAAPPPAQGAPPPSPSPLPPPASGRTTDDYGDPIARQAGPTGVTPSLVATHTIRAGLSNNMDQSPDATGAGPVESGLYTVYTPLGSDVRERDVLTIDGVRYSVQNKQTMDASGAPYAYQLACKRLSGGGYA